MIVLLALKNSNLFQAARQVADHTALKADFKLLRDDVALHLFRVASGLDSMVLGEGQIMSQVKAAHQAALRAGTSGTILNMLFKSALNCGKKVRAHTGLGRRAVSISSAAVELTRKLLGDLNQRSVCVIGAGRMGQICIKLLLSDNAQCTVYVANRGESKIKAMLAGNLRHLDRLRIVEDFGQRHAIAAKCDAVIVATSAHGFVLTEKELREARTSINPVGADFVPPAGADQPIGTQNTGSSLHSSPLQFQPSEIASIGENAPAQIQRSNTVSNGQNTSLHVIDMSVPRTVDPQLGTLDGVELYNFDNLSSIVKQNMAEREELTKDAEILIFEALKDFGHWLRTLAVVPVIAQLRGKVENIRQSYLHRGPRQHASKQLDRVSRLIVNRILHRPTTRLKAAQDYHNLQKQIETLGSLFDLDPLTPSK